MRMFVALLTLLRLNLVMSLALPTSREWTVGGRDHRR